MFLKLPGEAKVGENEMAVHGDHDVFRFEVSMNDAAFVDSFNCKKELRGISLGIVASEIIAHVDKVEQITRREVLSYYVEILAVVEGSVELHDAIFALEQEQGVSFSENAMGIPFVKLGHRLKSKQESGALLSDKMDRP